MGANDSAAYNPRGFPSSLLSYWPDATVSSLSVEARECADICEMRAQMTEQGKFEYVCQCFQ